MRLDAKPTGVCTLCDRPATQWIGRLIPLGNGQTVRQAAAVCDLHGLLRADEVEEKVPEP